MSSRLGRTCRGKRGRRNERAGGRVRLQKPETSTRKVSEQNANFSVPRSKSATMKTFKRKYDSNAFEKGYVGFWVEPPKTRKREIRLRMLTIQPARWEASKGKEDGVRVVT